MINHQCLLYGLKMTQPSNTIIQSVKESIKERASSPLYGCLIAAWLAYNWKPIAIFILSDENLYLKIKSISAYASPERQIWDPLMWGSIAAVLFPVVNGFYGFLEIITAALLLSKNNIKNSVIAWFKNYKDYWEFKAENLHKIRKAKLELTVSELEKKKAQEEYETQLTLSKVESLAQAENNILKLNQKIDNLELSMKEIKQNPLMMLNNKSEEEIAKLLQDYFMWRRNEHRNNTNYKYANYLRFVDTKK